MKNKVHCLIFLQIKVTLTGKVYVSNYELQIEISFFLHNTIA